jgi:glucose/arabinose dehydrogenase
VPACRRARRLRHGRQLTHFRRGATRVGAGLLILREPFVEGWLQGRKPWGRSVDVLVMPDGALLVSDDLAGAIYRVSYAR